ncbi:hypothetical protein Fot_03824 [Forsythia ovata]|uniref:Uncharacterized protein n=1 Tax=Forsythia ovata TaxID=205694 RepID=A0ABD1XET1_9LAMI
MMVHQGTLSKSHFKRAFVLFQYQNDECEALVAQATKLAEALQHNLVDFKDSDEAKQLYEDGKQAGDKDLIILIQPDMSFDFLFEGTKAKLWKLCCRGSRGPFYCQDLFCSSEINS